MTNPKVVFRAEVLTHYRESFHELVRAKLAEHGVDYILKVGRPRGAEAAKGDTIKLPWAAPMRSVGFGPRQRLLWQSGLSDIRADLVIVGQENRIISNYPLQALRSILPTRVAFFGHGRNFQAEDTNSLAERWKRFWLGKVDWWFAYTQQTKIHLIQQGFPADRITVFENAVDTSQLVKQRDAVSPERLLRLRSELGIAGQNVGIFVGGLYGEKRLGFLIEAARAIKERLPDFHLLIVGGGPELESLKAQVKDLHWVHVTGPRFGAEKVMFMKLARVFLMPGLVGLAILDAAALGLPTLTTAYPFHSPEVAYLENRVNGLMVDDWENPSAYADQVVGLLGDEETLSRMRAQATKLAQHYTIENMAERFAQGVLKALSAG